MTIRRFVHCIVLALALSLIAGHAQNPAPSATNAAKKPVFAGACKACPWGILAKVTADALSYYGYQTTICWDFEEPLIARLAQEPGYQRATVPLALFRGVDRPIPTVMRPNHFIYARDEAPDSFAYDVAKALDEHRDLFQVQLEPWYYASRPWKSIF